MDLLLSSLVFFGGGAPSAPPPAPPPPTGPSESELEAIKQAEALRQRKARGRRHTMLTSGLGDITAAPVLKTKLGGQ